MSMKLTIVILSIIVSLIVDNIFANKYKKDIFTKYLEQEETYHISDDVIKKIFNIKEK